MLTPGNSECDGFGSDILAEKGVLAGALPIASLAHDGPLGTRQPGPTWR
jgi:hypothetical protein